jgi:hypothetical protein
MDEHNGIDKMQELIDKYAGNVAILEEEIDVKLQLQYFNESKLQKKNLDKKVVLQKKEMLFNPDVTLTDKKLLLCQLASVNEVEAFRMLESYKANPDKALADWSVLAYQESKMLLQSTLLDDKPLFISTGLGGKGHRLRYFIVMLTNDHRAFSTYQEELVKGEVELGCNLNKAVLEEIEFYGYFATVQALVPIDVSLKKMLSDIVANCNDIGNFLNSSLLVTNVKKLSLGEIELLIDKNNSNKKNSNNGF